MGCSRVAAVSRKVKERCQNTPCVPVCCIWGSVIADPSGFPCAPLSTSERANNGHVSIRNGWLGLQILKIQSSGCGMCWTNKTDTRRPLSPVHYHLTGGGTKTTCVHWPSRFSTTSSAALWCFLGSTLVLWNHRRRSTTSTGTARMQFRTSDLHSSCSVTHFHRRTPSPSHYYNTACPILYICSERMSRLLVPFADQHVEIPSMTAGNIALTVGLKQVELL